MKLICRLCLRQSCSQRRSRRRRNAGRSKGDTWARQLQYSPTWSNCHTIYLVYSSLVDLVWSCTPALSPIPSQCKQFQRRFLQLRAVLLELVSQGLREQKQITHRPSSFCFSSSHSLVVGGGSGGAVWTRYWILVNALRTRWKPWRSTPFDTYE